MRSAAWRCRLNISRLAVILILLAFLIYENLFVYILAIYKWIVLFTINVLRTIRSSQKKLEQIRKARNIYICMVKISYKILLWYLNIIIRILYFNTLTKFHFENIISLEMKHLRVQHSTVFLLYPFYDLVWYQNIYFYII